MIATQTLPNKDSYAKDLSIWSYGETFPQVFAPLFAGVVLDISQSIGKNNGIDDLGLNKQKLVSLLTILLQDTKSSYPWHWCWLLLVRWL